MERLAQMVVDDADMRIEVPRDRILDAVWAWMSVQDDDTTSMDYWPHRSGCLPGVKF